VVSTVNGHGFRDGARLIRRIRAFRGLPVVIGGKFGIFGPGAEHPRKAFRAAGFDAVHETGAGLGGCHVPRATRRERVPMSAEDTASGSFGHFLSRAQPAGQLVVQPRTGMTAPRMVPTPLLATKQTHATTVDTITLDSRAPVGDDGEAYRAVVTATAPNGHPLAAYDADTTRAVLDSVTEPAFPVQVRHGSSCPEIIVDAPSPAETRQLRQVSPLTPPCTRKRAPWSAPSPASVSISAERWRRSIGATSMSRTAYNPRNAGRPDSHFRESGRCGGADPGRCLWPRGPAPSVRPTYPRRRCSPLVLRTGRVQPRPPGIR
jgi:hypothetical protein